MTTAQPSLLTRALSYWHWKCALMSATVRSIVYLVAMARMSNNGKFSIVLVEMTYVTLTAGLYAGMQQRALGLRSRRVGNLIVVLIVPALAQTFDWLTHLLAGEHVPTRALVSVSVFTLLSAFFHLYIMRSGIFLTGHEGHSLVEDFRRIPRLMLRLVLRPVRQVATIHTLLAARSRDLKAAA